MLGLIQAAPIYIIPFLLVLTLVVTVHELGHFLAAKACGVAIDRFSIGFGRAIFSWKDKAGVEWRVGWIPLGGYVRFSGDENASSVPDKEDLASLRKDIILREGVGAEKKYFHFKPLWQRAFVVAAGPLANFALSITLFAVLLFSLGQYVIPPRIAEVQPGSAAERAGIRPGDLILTAEGKKVVDFRDLAAVAQLRVNLPTEFQIQRGGQQMLITATSQWQMREDQFGAMRRQGTFGLKPVGEAERVSYGPVEAVGLGVKKTAEIVSTTVFYIGRMVTGQVAADQLSGPLGIAKLSGEVAKSSTAGAPDVGTMLLAGAIGLLQLAAAISVGVGFMNLLPVPVLDGGHLLFYAYEALARRPLAAKVQAAGYRVGLALVLGLMLFATWNDLQQQQVFKILGGLFS